MGIQNTDAQQTVSFNIDLEIAPSAIEADSGSHRIGYLSIQNEDGFLVKAPNDLKIILKSDNPNVVKVPESVIISEDESFTKFEITPVKSGIANISAQTNDSKDTHQIRVGNIDSEIPNDVKMKILLPTEQIHVNGEMPLSIIFTKNDLPIEMPKDTTVSFEYEDELIKIEKKQITIKKGSTYGINTITALEESGTGFIRATTTDKKFDTLTNIKVSSVNPSSIKTYIYPDMIAQETEREIEIFVTLVDAQGFPAIATEVVKLDIISDDPALSIAIDEEIRNNRAIIKKGSFGYHLTPEYIFPNKPFNYTVSVSSNNYGIDSERFNIVKPMSVDNPKADDKMVKIFVPPELPRGAKAIMVYQIGAIEDDDDDPADQRNFDVDETDLSEIVTVRTIDDLSEPDSDEGIQLYNIFPVQADRNYSVMSSAHESSSDNLRVISSNTKAVKIERTGDIVDDHILSHSSYGTATISTGQQTGEVTLSTSLKGLAVGSAKVQVINPVEPIKTKIFSPTGQTLAFDRSGKIELFVIPLDQSERPTNSETGLKYILLPINDIVNIEAQKNFASKILLSNDFAVSNQTSIAVQPIGIASDSNLEGSSEFGIVKSSAILNISIPFEQISSSKQQVPMILNMEDLFGNPITLSEDIQVSLESSNQDTIQVEKTVTLPAGKSFVETLIMVVGNQGNSEISLVSDTFPSSSITVTVGETGELEKRLNIFVNYPLEPLTVGSPTEITINVDDQNLDIVEGAKLRLIPEEGSSVFPTSVRTDEEGKASILFTPGVATKSILTIQATKIGYLDDQTVAEFSTSGAADIDGGISTMLLVGIAVLVAIVAIITLVVIRRRKPEEEYEEYEEES